MFGGTDSLGVGTGFYGGWTDAGGNCAVPGTSGAVYKWRIGTPANQRMTWDGNNLGIYNFDNQEIARFGSNNTFIKLGSASYSPDRFVLSGVNQRLTVNDGTRNRVVLGRHSDGTYGLSLYDPQGNTVLSSGGQLSNFGLGGNLVPASDLPSVLAPWALNYISAGTNYAVERDLAAPDWIALGTHNVGVRRWGNALNSNVGVYNSQRIAVIPAQRYEVSAYVAAHRCSAYVQVNFYDAASQYLASGVSQHTRASGGTSLSGWGRVFCFVTAPANAAFCHIFLQSGSADSGVTDCYFWGTRFYMGEAGVGQTVLSAWSASPVRGVTSLGFPFTSDTIGTFIDYLAVTNAYIANATISRLKIGANQVFFGNTQTAVSGTYYTGSSGNWGEIVGVTFSLDGSANALFVAGSSYDASQSGWWFSQTYTFEYRLVLKNQTLGTVVKEWQFKPLLEADSSDCGLGDNISTCTYIHAVENQEVQFSRGYSITTAATYRAALEVRTASTSASLGAKVANPYVSVLCNYATGV